MIISVDAEKAFDQISIHGEKSQKIRDRRKLKLIKGIYKKKTYTQQKN